MNYRANDCQPGDVLFAYGTGLFALAIRTLGLFGSRFSLRFRDIPSHVGIMAGVGHNKEVIEALTSCGVVDRPYWVYDKKEPHQIRRLVVNGEPIDFCQGQKVAKYARSLKWRHSYDWLGVISHVLKSFRDDPGRYFCSEVVRESANKAIGAGIPYGKLPPRKLLEYTVFVSQQR